MREGRAPYGRGFVRRNPLALSCKGSHVLVHAAEKRARADGASAAIAVVDAGGELVAFSRMDGASSALTGLALEGAREARSGAASHQGAQPIVVDGKTIGAVCVACDAPSAAAEAAKAALEAFHE